MGYEYLACRTNGHEWRTLPPIGMDREHENITRPYGGIFHTTLGIPSTCNVCHTERVRWLTRSGESILRYHHPDNYALKGEDKASAKDLRHDYAESIFNAFDEYVRGTAKPSS